METFAEEVAAAAGIAPPDGERIVRATLRALGAAVEPEVLPPALAALVGDVAGR